MKHNTDWFKEAGWGVFTHYIADAVANGKDTTVQEWNKLIDQFDVDGLVRQLETVGAKYYFITLGQNSGHFCSPNSTYDDFVGIKPSKCARRDLVADLYDALNPKGIKLLVYAASGAPANDPVAVEKLKWEWGYEGGWPPKKDITKRTGKRLKEFQIKWEAIIREWSLRWGTKVAGWWFDGCYFADEMYRYPDPPNFQSFAAAVKAGNPDSIVAFNPGVKVPVISITEHEDYTAGEIANAFPVCPGRWVNGVQYHILSYLGSRWCGGEPRFSNEFVAGYTKDVNAKGGVITWDVPITKSGLIPQPFIDQLAVSIVSIGVSPGNKT